MNNNINSFINLLLKTIEEDKVFVMPINGTSMLPFLDSSKKVKLKKAESLKKGEMYFYYFPKGIIKKKPVNCYEIPSLFDIDEDALPIGVAIQCEVAMNYLTT